METSTFLKRNMGLTDRSLRTIVGLGLIGFAVSGDRTGYEWLGWIGVVPLLTGLVGICPLYKFIGLDTRGH